jgi:hypothetical protein
MTAYSTRHWRVRERRGPANLRKCVHCTASGSDKQARDWACLHDRDGEDVMDYIPLCRKCHIAYDGSGHRTPHSEETKALLGEKNRSYKHTAEAVEKIRATSTGRKHTPESIAKMSVQQKAAAAARGPMSADRRSKISATLKGNTNASGNAGGKRSGQALENIRAGQERRRQRERAAREVGES